MTDKASNNPEKENEYLNGHYLMSVEELAAHLETGDVKVFDTTVYLHPAANGYTVTSGYERYLEQHIPNAGFIDLADGWAAADPNLRFTLPEIDDLQKAIGASGISPEDHVVLYASGHLMWATRAWWLLYHAGHRNMSVLQGSFAAWTAAGQPVASGGHVYPPVSYTAKARNKFVDTAGVEAGMHGRVCTVNALSPALYEGSGDFYYQRRGHIPGSLGLYYDELLDDQAIKPAPEVYALLKHKGMLGADKVITYCGGGIAATLDAFACVLCGQEDVLVYDGSMSEWVQDPNRPLTEGADP